MNILSAVTGITGWKWKLGAIGGILALIAVSGFLAYAQIENRHLTQVNAALDSRINDPRVGLLVTVAQCHTNAATAVGAVEQQNTALQQQSSRDRAALAESTKSLAAAQAKTRRAQDQVAVMLSTKPQGATLEARVNDVDARLMETLK